MQEACRLRLQRSFREPPEALRQSVLLLTLLTQVSPNCWPALVHAWSPVTAPQAGWQRRARASDGSQLTKASFVRCDHSLLASRCALETDVRTSGGKVTGRLFTDVPAQSLRRSSRLSCHPAGPLEVRDSVSRRCLP